MILIDEIDKAESDVPNGLLEAFGSREFTPQGWDEPVALSADAAAPLMIITTNEERVLPDAFIRRCFVLQIELPKMPVEWPASDAEKQQHTKFVDYLTKRGKVHFKNGVEETAHRRGRVADH